MIPLLVPILTTLASNGLGILAGAIQAKGKALIEEKLGVTIPDDASKLTPDLIAHLKEKEMEHEEFLINAQIEKAKVDLEQDKLDNANTDSAREMNAKIQESAVAAPLAKVAAYYLDFAIVGAAILMTFVILFVTIPEGNKPLAFTMLGSLWTLCGTVVNFHRGTSASSHRKDAKIDELTKVPA